MQLSPKLIDVKYFFYSIHFNPYSHVKNRYDSRGILKDVISHLSNIKTQGKAVLIDRNENKENSLPREIFCHLL